MGESEDRGRTQTRTERSEGCIRSDQSKEDILNIYQEFLDEKLSGKEARARMAMLHKRAIADQIDDIDMMRTFMGIGIFSAIVLAIGAIFSKDNSLWFLILVGLSLLSSVERFKKLTAKAKELESRNAVFADFMQSAEG